MAIIDKQVDTGKTMVKKKTAKKTPSKKTTAAKKAGSPLKDATAVPRARKSAKTVALTKVKKPAKKTATAKKKAPAKKRSATKLKPSTPGLTISADHRQELIAKAAFLISTKRHCGFDDQHRDWLQAETVIDMIFSVKT
jgi:hypothetical protein